MCTTVFKKIPCKWLLPDDPPMALLLQEVGAGLPCQGTAKARDFSSSTHIP